MKVQCRLFFVGVYGLQRGELFFLTKEQKNIKVGLRTLKGCAPLRGGHPLRTFQNFVFLFFCQKMFKVFAVYCLWADMQDFANL